VFVLIRAGYRLARGSRFVRYPDMTFPVRHH